MQIKYRTHQFPLCVHHSPSTHMCTCASFCLFCFYTMSSICSTLYISAHSHAPYSTHMCPATRGHKHMCAAGEGGAQPHRCLRTDAAHWLQPSLSCFTPPLGSQQDCSLRWVPMPFPPALLPCHSPAHVPPPKAHFIPQLRKGPLQKRVKKRARAREKKKGTKAI